MTPVRRHRVARRALAAVLAVVLLACSSRETEEFASTWSVVVDADGAVIARPVDVTTLDVVGTEELVADPPQEEVVEVSIAANGVAQRLANGVVRWVGLVADGDTVSFEQRLLWRGSEQDAPQPVGIGASGRAMIVAIDTGEAVLYREPGEGPRRLRLVGERLDFEPAVGGADGLVAFTRPNGALALLQFGSRAQIVLRNGTDATPVALTDAGTSVLMRFDDGSVLGHHVDSGVTYDVWPSAPDRAAAVSAAGNALATVVVDADGVVHLVGVDDETVLAMPDGEPAVDVSAVGDRATVVLRDGSVVHVGLDRPATDEVATPVRQWPPTTGAVAAGLIEPSRP